MPSTIDDCKLLFPVVFKLVSISHLLVGLTLFALYQLDRGSAQDKDSSYLGLFKRRYVFFLTIIFQLFYQLKHITVSVVDHSSTFMLKQNTLILRKISFSSYKGDYVRKLIFFDALDIRPQEVEVQKVSLRKYAVLFTLCNGWKIRICMEMSSRNLNLLYDLDYFMMGTNLPRSSSCSFVPCQFLGLILVSLAGF